MADQDQSVQDQYQAYRKQTETLQHIRAMLNYAGDAGDRITQDAAAWRYAYRTAVIHINMFSFPCFILHIFEWYLFVNYCYYCLYVYYCH